MNCSESEVGDEWPLRHNVLDESSWRNLSQIQMTLIQLSNPLPIELSGWAVRYLKHNIKGQSHFDMLVGTSDVTVIFSHTKTNRIPCILTCPSSRTLVETGSRPCFLTCFTNTIWNGFGTVLNRKRLKGYSVINLPTSRSEKKR